MTDARTFKEDRYLEIPPEGEAISPIAFGRVLERLDSQKEDIHELKETLTGNGAKLDLLIEYHNKQKGAVSVLMMVASAIGAVVSAVISWWLSLKS